jgi:phosphate starvation-inducible membrane PsiE
MGKTIIRKYFRSNYHLKVGFFLKEAIMMIKDSFYEKKIK